MLVKRILLSVVPTSAQLLTLVASAPAVAEIIPNVPPATAAAAVNAVASPVQPIPAVVAAPSQTAVTDNSIATICEFAGITIQLFHLLE